MVTSVLDGRESPIQHSLAKPNDQNISVAAALLALQAITSATSRAALSKGMIGTEPFQHSSSLWYNFLQNAKVLKPKATEIPTVEKAYEMLSQLYGTKLLDRVKERYGLKNQNDKLDYPTLQMLAIGIAANVHVNDLIDLFEVLKENKALYLDIDWSQFKSFDELNDLHIGKLLSHFRPAELDDKIDPYDKKKLFNVNSVPKQFRKLLTHDIEILRKCKMAADSALPGRQDVATSEYLAHDAAYAPWQEGMVVPVRNIDGSFSYEQVRKSVNIKGYVCHILTPIRKIQPMQDHTATKDQTCFPIKVLFRGTKDSHSIGRDVHLRKAPGHKSFQKHRENLIEDIRKVIPEVIPEAATEGVVIDFIGHSLGGSDACRGAAALAHAIAQAKLKQTPNDCLLKIRHVNVKVWHSANIAKETNDEFIQAEEIINQHQNVKQINCPIDYFFDLDLDGQQSYSQLRKEIDKTQVVFKILFGKVDHDGVQKAGQVMLGEGLVPSKFVLREVYQFKWIRPPIFSWNAPKLKYWKNPHGQKSLNKQYYPTTPAFQYANSDHHPHLVDKMTMDQFGRGWFQAIWSFFTSIYDFFRWLIPTWQRTDAVAKQIQL